MSGPVTVPMGPAVANLIGIRAGDRNLILATITAKGEPVDLTGKTVSAQARSKAVDPDPPVLKADVEVLDAAGGKISIKWPGDEVRAALGDKATWKGVWDLQVEEPGEDPITLCAGTFQAEMDVTR